MEPTPALLQTMKVVADPEPEVVVIVSFGENQDSGKNFQKAIVDQKFVQVVVYFVFVLYIYGL